MKFLISIVLISKLHCCSVQWGLSSLTVWHILEQACFCLIIIPMGLNVWSRYQEVIVVDLLNMKDFDTYEALFITLPVVFIALVILLLIYSQKRPSLIIHHSVKCVTFVSVLNLLSLKSQETLFYSIWCCCFISWGKHKYDESGELNIKHWKQLWCFSL